MPAPISKTRSSFPTPARRERVQLPRGDRGNADRPRPALATAHLARPRNVTMKKSMTETTLQELWSGRETVRRWASLRCRSTHEDADPMPDETITHLEMTSQSQLVPGRPPPSALEMEEAGRAAAPVLRSTYVRIGAPHGWRGRSAWSDAEWEEEVVRPGVHAWIARVDDDVAGLVELEAEPNGDVGIVVLGLVPEFVGKGFGGALLTLATRLAWEVTSPGGTSAKRVLVQTSSRDHPHAVPNYKRRGFRTFRTERRSLEDSPGSAKRLHQAAPGLPSRRSPR